MKIKKKILYIILTFSLAMASMQTQAKAYPPVLVPVLLPPSIPIDPSITYRWVKVPVTFYMSPYNGTFPFSLIGLLKFTITSAIIYGITQIPVVNKFLEEEILPTLSKWWKEVKSWFGADDDDEYVPLPEPTPVTDLPSGPQRNMKPEGGAKNDYYISGYDSTESYMTATTCPKGMEDSLIDIRLVQGETDEIADEFQKNHDLHQCVKFYIAHPNAFSEEGWLIDSDSFKVIEEVINHYVSGGEFIRKNAYVRIQVKKTEEGLYDLGLRELTLKDEIFELKESKVENDKIKSQLATLKAYLKTLKEELEALKSNPATT